MREVDAFGSIVRSHRHKLGLSQEELAERAGLSVRAIRDVERGAKHVPRRETVQLLADALELGGSEREAFQVAARRMHALGHPARPRSLDHGLATPSSNLPNDPTPFIGREDEMRELLALLQRPAVRLVTLTGPGGIGKTRLALQAADHLRDVFRDGVFVVSLASLQDPDLVPTVISRTLGIEEQGRQSLLDTLTVFLQTKQLLLLLDNYEHVLPAAEVLSKLLSTCPQLQILVTSRTVLHLAAEYDYPVPPLTLPDLVHLPDLETLAQCDAVAFFLERTQAVKPGFTLTRQNAGTVAMICSRLDGLPLAIELAAARLRLFPPQELLRRLGQRLDLLTGGASDRPTRLQTLRGAMDWSYSLLDAAEQRLFARLSVFAGGCTLEAIEAVCNSEADLGINVLNGVSSLLDKSLIRQVGEDEPRFGMLETIRQYAAEKLVEQDEEMVGRSRHALYFMSVSERAEQGLQGTREAFWLAALEQEHDNLRAALQYSLQSLDRESILRMGTSLWRFWQRHGHMREGYDWLGAGLTMETAVSPQLQARALRVARSLAWSVGEREDEGVGEAHNAGDYRRATALLEESLARHRAQDSREGLMHGGLGRALYSLALVLNEQGDYVRAKMLQDECLAFHRELGDQEGIAWALLGLGDIARNRGDSALAREYCEQAFARFQELGHAPCIGFSLNNLALAAYMDGDLARAADFAEKSEAVFRGVHVGTYKAGLAEVLVTIGRIRGAQGQTGAAHLNLTEGLDLAWKEGPHFLVPAALEALAVEAVRQGLPDDAVTILGATAQMRRTLGVPVRPADQPELENALSEARWMLAVEAFDAAWSRGQSMSTEQIVRRLLVSAAP